MTDDSRAGVVLAGGFSTRFGETDKAVAELAGTPMIRRVVDRLGRVVDDCVINCRDDQREAIETALEGSEPNLTYATDPEPDRGPLAGIRVGLEASDAAYAAVVACDMPHVDPGVLDYLFERARGHDAAVVTLEDGWHQTTQAVYRADAMARACERALEEGDGRIVTAFDRIDVELVDEAELEEVPDRTFESIDTQAALRDAERHLEG